MKNIVGYKIEPLKNLLTQETIGYEVLSILQHDTDTENYFSTLSCKKNIQLFYLQLDWCSRQKRDKKFFLNLSVAALTESTLCDSLTQRMVFPLCIEIQDPHSLSNLNSVRYAALSHNLYKLRSQGCEVWLDDFTAALTDVASQPDFRFDGIKLDKSELLAGDTALHRTVAFCKTITTKVIVEGIETSRHLDSAVKSGADIGQGYLWEKEIIQSFDIKPVS